jgi:hypothetical protein
VLFENAAAPEEIFHEFFMTTQELSLASVDVAML